VDASSASVSITQLAPFVRLLEESGPVPLERMLMLAPAVFERWGIDLNHFDADLTTRLPHGLVVELSQLLIEVLDDPSALMRAGGMLQVGDYELLEYLCTTTQTLGEAIACLGRYYPLLVAAEFSLVIDGDRAEARFRIAEGLPAPDSFHEFAIASNLTMTALHIDLTEFSLPTEICFAHPEPSYIDSFPDVFGPVPVRFECEHNAIVFPVSMLARPMRSADRVLHGVLTRLADEELSALDAQSAFPARVREAIDAELARGATLEAVADRLHMSASTLRSKLRQHGTSYSELLDRLRGERAKRALRQSQLSIAEIAHQLGFAHPPAFVRAFRRWFGVAPSEFREAPSDHPAFRLLPPRPARSSEHE
jgi:AraC-like DNA-binding protein